MRYMATIYISDVMESVAMTLEVEGWSEQYGPPDTLGRATYVWRGVGEDDWRPWLGRALFLASEEVSKAPLEGRSGAEPMGGRHTISETGDIGV